MSTVLGTPEERKFEREPAGQPVHPFRDLKGEAIGAIVRALVEGAIAEAPPEVLIQEPDSIKAIQGKAYASFSEEYSLVREAAGRDPTNILSGTITDASTEHIINDETRAHFLGVGIHPVVRPVRGMITAARALEEVSRARWRMTKFEEVAELVLADARLRGTGAVHVFFDPEIGLARAVRVPPGRVALDPGCQGDLSRTKWRAVIKRLPRHEVRRLWGDEAANSAGRRLDPSTRLTAAQVIHREMEDVEVIDFYYRYRGVVRHIVLVEGVLEPVVDRDHWPYDLPPGYWPIIVYRWHTLPDRVYGQSDFSRSKAWHEIMSWLVRFVSIAAAQSTKKVVLYDPAIFNRPEAEDILQNLRRPFDLIPANLRELSMGNFSTADVLRVVDIPSQVRDLWRVLEIGRGFLSESTLMRDMERRNQNPMVMPARLGRALASWKAFLREVLTVQSIVDLQTVPKDALVELRTQDDEGKVTVRMVYMDLFTAEKLQRNLVPGAIQRGLKPEEFAEGERDEYTLRIRTEIKDGSRVRRLRPEERVFIRHPGIARYVSRPSMVEKWPGTRLTVDQVLTEFEFDVDIVSSLDMTDQQVGRWAELMERLAAFYSEFGLREALLAWANEYQQARQQGRPLPQPPKMVSNILALHRNLTQSLGLVQRGELDIGSEDLAAALAYAATAAQQAQEREAELSQRAQMARTEVQARIAELRMQAEMAKQQAEIARQWAEFIREVNRTLIEGMKARAERERSPHLIRQQQARAAAAQARAIREAVEAARIAQGQNPRGSEGQ